MVAARAVIIFKTPISSRSFHGAAKLWRRPESLKKLSRARVFCRFTGAETKGFLKPPIILPSVRAIRFRTSRSSKRAPCEYARLQIFPLRIIEITVTASLIGKVYLVGAEPGD